VKWEGFEKKSDRTFEPEENLIGPILDEYIESIGGREKLYEPPPKTGKGKKRGRTAADDRSTPSKKRSRRNGEHPADSEEPASLKKKEFKPPAGSWENEIDYVDMCRDDKGGLIVYLTWKNGSKTQHPPKQAYMRCPQKVGGAHF